MSETPTEPDTVDTSALDQSSESLDLARDALSTVAGNDDVTTGDDAEAGTYSQDPTEAAVNADNITGGDHDQELPDAEDEADHADPDAP